jgi:tetratricopeptide (TPR) repeat protein
MGAKPRGEAAGVHSDDTRRRSDGMTADSAQMKTVRSAGKPPDKLSALARSLSVAAALIVGAALCYGGAAQLAAGLLQARAAAVLSGIDWDKDNAPGAAVGLAVADLNDADRWWPQSVNAYDRATAEARLATRSETASAARPMLDAALRDLGRSLKQDPANAGAWAWLAFVLFAEQGASPATIDSLSMSIELARFDPALLPIRCEVGLFIYPALDSQRRAALGDQIRMLGRYSVGDLVEVARVTHSLNIVIEALLAGDNRTVIRFLDVLQS